MNAANIANKSAATNNPFVAMNRKHSAIVVVVFTLFLVLVAIARTYDPAPVDDWIPTLLTIYVGILALPFVFLRRDFGWFHPVTFVVFMSFVQLLRRFSVYAWGLDWHQAVPLRREGLSELIELQLLMHSLALVSFYTGYLLAPRLPAPRLSLAENPPALVPKLVLINVFSFVVFLLFLASRGGLDAHIGGWSHGRHAEFAGQYYTTALMSLGVLSCWIWLAYRKNATYSVTFWGCTLVALGVAFLSLGSRSSAIYPVFVGLVIWMLRERRIVFVPIAVGVVVAIYVVGALGAFRRSGWVGEANWEAATESSFTSTVIGTTQGEIAQRSSSGDAELAVYGHVPDEVALLWGSSYANAMVTPIPRALWPGKPGQVGGLAGRVFFRMDAGAPPGAVGEAYWNFHVPGVIGIFGLFGIIVNWLARTFQRNADQRGAVALYAPTLFLAHTPDSSAFVACIIPLASLLLIFVVVGIVDLGPRQPVATPRPQRTW